MSRRTLPAVTSPNFPEKVKEIIEIREGIRGSRMSGFVTFKDLEEHDPLRNQPSGPLVIQGDPPAAPSNLQIQAGMLGNTLKWDESSSKDVWYYEIWVANSQNRSEAELIAIVSHPNTKYVHSLDSGSVNDDHYYWIRAVNWSGLYSSWEPPDAQGGYLVEGSTSYSEMTSEILGVLQDRIVELNEDHFVENPYGVYNNTFYIALEGEEENHVFPFIVGEIEGVPTVGINGQLVVDGSIYADAIAADQITGTHIAANSIEASHIQAGAIEVGYDEITGDKPPVDADKTSADNVQSVISQVDIDNAKANGQTLISGGYINTDILQVDYGIIVGDKPPSDADKTSNNTAYDTSRVGGTSATTVRNNASTGASHAGIDHAPSNADNTSTVIGGGFITTGWIADSSSNPNLRVDFNNAEITVNTSNGLKLTSSGEISIYNSSETKVGVISFDGTFSRFAAISGPLGIGSVNSYVNVVADGTNVTLWANRYVEFRPNSPSYWTECRSDFYPASSENWDIGSSGRRWDVVYCDTLNESSGRDSKKDLEPADIGLDFVLQLQAKKGRRLNETDGYHYWFIAEEVEALAKKEGVAFSGVSKDRVFDVELDGKVTSVPAAKYTADKGKVVGERDEYGLAYSEFIPVLASAIQELSYKVKALEAIKNGSSQ